MLSDTEDNSQDDHLLNNVDESHHLIQSKIELMISPMNQTNGIMLPQNTSALF